MPSKPHVYLPKGSVEYGVYKMDKKGKNEYIQHLHSKTGDPYTHVKLPNLKKRTKTHGEQAYRFGIDKNGIDLDQREAYIQVPADCITHAWNKDINMLQWYFNNPDATFNVYFKAQYNRETHTWDKPAKPKIGIQEIMRMFPDTQEKALKISPKRRKRDIQKKQEKDVKEQAKERTKPTRTADRER